MARRSKYGSHKKTFAGITFDSTLEMNRYIFLLGELNSGHIRNLRKQVPYVLIEDVTDTREVQLKTKVRIEEYTVERGCRYLADFVYQLPISKRQMGL